MDKITVEKVGNVQNSITQRMDTHWGAVQSRIALCSEYEGALKGLESFSHALVITYLHQAGFDAAKHLQRHPQNREDLPKLGIFAQRGKNRPNPIGVTAVKIVDVQSDGLVVQGLDCIDGTPVLDIKPYFPQYDHVSDSRNPEWVNQLMEHYF